MEELLSKEVRKEYDKAYLSWLLETKDMCSTALVSAVSLGLMLGPCWVCGTAASGWPSHSQQAGAGMRVCVTQVDW